jgi:hypothetical protein
MHTGRNTALCCCPCYSACSYYSQIFHLKSKYSSLFFCCCAWNNTYVVVRWSTIGEAHILSLFFVRIS